MTIAELHGKLAPDRPSGVHERMEDLLTSDVFSAMKYAGWEHGFLDWLLEAEPAPVEPSAPPIGVYFSQAKITDVQYSFWPKLKNNREPDVALLFCFDSQDLLLVLVEAKYLSGTRDWEGDEEINPFGLTGNQIADQVQGFKDMGREEFLNWFQSSKAIRQSEANGKFQKIHLFITMHSVLPVHDYEYSMQHLGASWPIHSYWLSWISLAGSLRVNLDQTSTGLASLITDLYALLQRKGLVPFRGFRMHPWGIYQQNPSFWLESWWASEPVDLYEYSTFWHEILWQTRPIGFVPNGSFWKGDRL